MPFWANKSSYTEGVNILNKTSIMNNHQLIAFIERDKTDTSTSSWISPMHKYFFVGLGKTASTRIKLSLHILEGYEVIETPFPWLHARTKTDETFIPRLSNFDLTEAHHILTSPDWFRFGFVRNPYDRLFSAYKSFIMQEVIPPSPFYNNIKEKIRTTYDYMLRAGMPNATVSFRDFIKYVQATLEQEPDYHWCTMTGALRPDMIQYDLVGYFENFNEDFKKVLKKLGVNDELMPELLEPVNVSNLKNLPLAAVYDWDLAETVYDLYKEDFKIYGYKKNSWLLS